MTKIVALEQHVTELGKADAGVAILHSRTDGVLRDHGIHRNVLSDVAKKIEDRERSRPVVIVDETGRICGHVEVEELCELGFDRGDVVRDLVGRLEIALGGLAGWVTNHAGGTAGKRDGEVAVELEAAER